MTCITILRNTLNMNAAVITAIHTDIDITRAEAAAHHKNGDIAFCIAANEEVAHLKLKLAKKVALQKRVKVEIAALFRNARIERKYTDIFGKPPTKQVSTSYEQEAMLDSLIADRDADKIAAKAADKAAKAARHLADMQVVKTA